MSRDEGAPNSRHISFEAIDIYYDDSDPLNQRRGIMDARDAFFQHLVAYRDQICRSVHPVPPDIGDQLIHGDYVNLEEIREAKKFVKDMDMLNLLDYYKWDILPEISIVTHFGREEFKKRGGLGALVNSGKRVYLSPHLFDLKETFYILEESMNIIPNFSKPHGTFHPILERGLHPTPVDAYYAVNDSVNRMINSESFKKMREEKQWKKQYKNLKPILK